MTDETPLHTALASYLESGNGPGSHPTPGGASDMSEGEEQEPRERLPSPSVSFLTASKLDERP